MVRADDLSYHVCMTICTRILIIEDDADINNVVATFLSKRGFACTQAFSGSEARLVLSHAGDKGAFDLVVTDLMLPGLSGGELVELIRMQGDTPVIVISAQAAPVEKMRLFGLGADDYLVKPFDLDELVARIQVQLRHAARANARVADSGAIDSPRDGTAAVHFKAWTLDVPGRALTAAGVPVKLTRIEFNIVEVLVRWPRKVFTKQELFEAAWNEECFAEEKAVNVHVSNIRSKLRPTGTESYIETVWGIGFKLAE